MQHCIAAVGFTGSPGWFTVGRRAKVPHAAMLGANSGEADETAGILPIRSIRSRAGPHTYCMIIFRNYIIIIYCVCVCVNIVSYIQYINVLCI